MLNLIYWVGFFVVFSYSFFKTAKNWIDGSMAEAVKGVPAAEALIGVAIGVIAAVMLLFVCSALWPLFVIGGLIKKLWDVAG